MSIMEILCMLHYRLMYSNGVSGGSNLDMCGKCSNTSREALHKRTSAEGKLG